MRPKTRTDLLNPMYQLRLNSFNGQAKNEFPKFYEISRRLPDKF